MRVSLWVALILRRKLLLRNCVIWRYIKHLVLMGFFPEYWNNIGTWLFWKDWTNLLEFLEYVSNYIDQECPVDVIYLDFQKAFDKVPRRRLMLKIKSLGIAGNMYNWIEDLLKDREQRVVLLGCNSEWIKVKSGVPRGSGLGPFCSWYI